jgi:hypothetical protein
VHEARNVRTLPSAVTAWWSRFVKAWRKIGNAYRNRNLPPPKLRGCEAFVMPDHAPLIPKVIEPVVPEPVAIALPTPSYDDSAEQSCARKTRYATEDRANAVAIQCWHERSTWLRAYSCTFCGGFHLTRSNAPPRMKPGWRLPKISERQENTMRNERQRRRRRRV